MELFQATNVLAPQGLGALVRRMGPLVPTGAPRKRLGTSVADGLRGRAGNGHGGDQVTRGIGLGHGGGREAQAEEGRRADESGLVDAL
jgi:hypothetical protein